MCVTPHQEKLQCDNNHNQKSSGITQEKKSNMDSKQQQDQRASQLKSSKYDLGQMDNGFYKIHESIIKLQQEAFSLPICELFSGIWVSGCTNSIRASSRKDTV